MKFTLIVCTYMRPKPLLDLLKSVNEQTLYPNEILIVDGSTDNETEIILKQNTFKNLNYFKVEEQDRGLTKQRNFGIKNVSDASEIICFLDDDTVLETSYFESIMQGFQSDNNIVGVGGVSINENRWKPKQVGKVYSKYNYYEMEGWICKEGLRNRVRNYLGLHSPLRPNKMPNFSHGRTCSYPLTGRLYEVDLLIGMSMNFRAAIFEHINFSTYFEGYGLYEDADFSIRAQQFGKLAISTLAKLEHYHDSSGRPNQYKYGKMVTRNGWYVWRLKYPNPSIKAKLKWHATAILLTKIRLLNVVTTSKKKEAFTEALGRIVGWFSLFLKPPKLLR